MFLYVPIRRRNSRFNCLHDLRIKEDEDCKHYITGRTYEVIAGFYSKRIAEAGAGTGPVSNDEFTIEAA